MKYTLNDIEVVTQGDPKTFNCSHQVGQGLIFKGENMVFKAGTRQFSHYVLATLLPYVAARQRVHDKDDWMFFESDIACPDPKCGAVFKFKRLKKRQYNYEVVKVAAKI